jgi:hypothetical protein
MKYQYLINKKEVKVFLSHSNNYMGIKRKIYLLLLKKNQINFEQIYYLIIIYKFYIIIIFKIKT